MHELDNTIKESLIKRLDKVLHMSDKIRNKEVLKWYQQRGKCLTPRKIQSRSDRFALYSNFGGRSKTGKGLKIVMDTFVYEIDVYYLNRLIENDNFIEYAKVSIGLPLNKYFKNIVLINNHKDANTFQ